MDMCIITQGCNAIAFPGCYLLNKSHSEIIEQLPEVDPPEDRSYTALVVKKDLQTMARGIAGYPGVRSSTDDATYDGLPHADKALLNRPTGCAVDKHGDLFILDTWNQKVRQVTGLQTECIYQED